MRFVTACADCGPIVVPAHAMAILASPGTPPQGIFDCPVCLNLCAVGLGRAAVSVLMASGAAVVPRSQQPDEAPLSLCHLVELQTLLSDDEAWRQVLDEAS